MTTAQIGILETKPGTYFAAVAVVSMYMLTSFDVYPVPYFYKDPCWLFAFSKKNFEKL